MGDKSSNKRKKKRVQDTCSSSSESPSSSEYSSSDGESDRKHSRKRRKHSSRHRDERRRSSERSKSRREKRDRHKKKNRRGKKEVSESGDEGERVMEQPEEVIRFILKEFPAVAADLEQLLRMIDDGQAVDISGLSERSLVKHLRKLFLSLNLKETVDLVFLLPSNVCPTLEVVGSILRPNAEPPAPRADNPVSEIDVQSVPPDAECRDSTGDFNLKLPSPRKDVAPRRRVIGPEMPSAELLAAAAKLTEAEAELREAEIDGDSGVFIGPPPPAVVKEAESANEAERFEEVTRIMGAEVDSPYDVVGVNRNMSAENIKKRYWKLSLMVHPDKCPHPQANQAFIILNKAFKDLQDPDKRKALDDKIIHKEEQEKFKAELKEMREAAHWRRLQGISMEGDEALLADMDVKVEQKREEWMTTLPPERKPGGMPTHSTTFSRNSKEGRGDTSAWTDTPSDRAQKAKMNYLEAYNATAALASNDGQNQNTNIDAEMVDKYNKAKRSKSLVEKHKETAGKRYKKKSKQESSKEEEWEGQHPWKPWDREKDLTAGRQNVKLDAENMSEGLSSRFSSGSFQRNFL